MKIIDPHHHLWDMSRLNYPWLNDTEKTAFFGDYSALATNYLAGDFIDDSGTQELAASVHVQAEADPLDPIAETRWLSEVAENSAGVPTGIVAYADFTLPNIASVLARHSDFDRVRGIRQILNFHEDSSLSYTEVNLLKNEVWLKNFSLLEHFNLSFDLQIYHQQMELAACLAEKHAGIQFILNHTGMPVERDAIGVTAWRKGMARLAQCPNMAVKISGLGMCEPSWSTDSIRPYVRETIDYFGVERCMFASNFPVDGLFGSYDRLYQAYRDIVSRFSDSAKHSLFYDNAARIYRL